MSDWPVWLLAVIDVLAVHRVTRFVTEDILPIRVRWSVIRWSYRSAGLEVGDDPDETVEADMLEQPATTPKVAVLVRCRWCASVWVAAGVVIAHSVAPGVWLPIGAVLALSSAAVLLARIED